jgi:hypothetical protein
LGDGFRADDDAVGAEAFEAMIFGVGLACHACSTA